MLRFNINLQRDAFTLQADFEISDQGVTVIFGHSGSGKSTLLKCIAGLEQSIGEIFLNQQCWQSTDQNVFLKSKKRQLGYVFQEPRLFPHLNVEENMRLGLVEKSNKNSQGLIDLLQLRHLLNRKPGELSGGELRRVSIGRALLRNPSVLMFDEPLTGIDLVHRKQMLPYIQKVTRGLSVPVLYVTHHIEEVLALADHIVLIEEGRLICHEKFSSFVLHSKRAVDMGVAGSCISIEGFDNVQNGEYFIPATQLIIAAPDAQVAGKLVLSGRIDAVLQCKDNAADFIVNTELGQLRIVSESLNAGFPIKVGKDYSIVINQLIKR